MGPLELPGRPPEDRVGREGSVRGSPSSPGATLSDLVTALSDVVGRAHVLTDPALVAGYVVDWTGLFRGTACLVVRPADRIQVQAVLAECSRRGVPVVPQGGNTGLVGGGVPLHGEVLLSLRRLDAVGVPDPLTRQVTAGAGATLAAVSAASPSLETGVQIGSRHAATVGGSVATNAGGTRVLRYGHVRQQLRGLEVVLSDGTLLSHLGGLVKDNTGYDWVGLMAGSEGTLGVVTAARLQLYPRAEETVTVVVGLPGMAAVHAAAAAAVRSVEGLRSAEFFTEDGLGLLTAHLGVTRPFSRPCPAYLLLEATGPEAFAELGAIAGDAPAAVASDAQGRRLLWRCREQVPEAAGLLGKPLKLDVAVPAERWVELAENVRARVLRVDPEAVVFTFGHVADGNVHVNVVPGGPVDGRHQDAVLGFVAELGGSISAEHGIGALKAAWLHLARSPQERTLFKQVRRAFDPAGVMNPHVLPA